LLPTARGRSKVSLEVLHDPTYTLASYLSIHRLVDSRIREVKLISLLFHILLGEMISDHELCEISDNLGRRSDFDNISTKLVGVDVSSFDFCPLLAET
jgi:hypothetical protein